MFSLSASNVTVSSFWSESRSNVRCSPEIAMISHDTVAIINVPDSREPSQPMAEKQWPSSTSFVTDWEKR